MAIHVVALDGPSGAGKSTVARLLAARLGWNHIDTGAMYRCVALKADRLAVPLDDDEALDALCRTTDIELRRGDDGGMQVWLDGADVTAAIREHRISDLASRVSARQPVRSAMGGYQRRLGAAAPSVLEGRDIGTVVFPDALLKVYLTASAEERARRRTEEIQGRGQEAEFDAILRDIRTRDAQDQGRAHAPLRSAQDAVRLDTTGLPVAAVVERLEVLVKQRLGG